MPATDRPLHEWPQITNGALDWLNSFLTPDSLVFEWGSGGSTLYIAKRVKKIISIEHNPQWWKKMVTTAEEWGIRNCKCVLVEPEPIYESDVPPGKTRFDLESCWSPYGFPRRMRRKRGLFTLNFEKYVKTICKYSDATFDLVFIDGRARSSCILFGRNKVKPGGYLMLDDAQRRRYKRAKKLLTSWKATDFYGTGKYLANRKWSTQVFKRPF